MKWKTDSVTITKQRIVCENALRQQHILATLGKARRSLCLEQSKKRKIIRSGNRKEMRKQKIIKGFEQESYIIGLNRITGAIVLKLDSRVEARRPVRG